jgi:hypothetical protein
MMLAWLVAILVNSPSHQIRRNGPQMHHASVRLSVLEASQTGMEVSWTGGG